jgi:hypothetical protein
VDLDRDRRAGGGGRCRHLAGALLTAPSGTPEFSPRFRGPSHKSPHAAGRGCLPLGRGEETAASSTRNGGHQRA